MRDDLTSALRQIQRNPGFTTATVLTLALGVGAVTAVLTIADPMLFRPLPFLQPDRIFVLGAGNDRLHMPDAVRVEAFHQAFSSVGDFDGPIDVGRIGDAPEQSLSYAVSPGYLPALGVTPILGRMFRRDEYTREHHTGVALITYGLWQSMFGGNADVLGRRVSFGDSNAHSYEIVGVLPREFFLPDLNNQQPGVLIPALLDAAETRPNVVIWPLARLRDGMSVGAATAELQAITEGVERDFPAYERGRKVELIPLRDYLFGRVRTPLLMLLAATGCILLLASANLAQLAMARIRARGREVGIRIALGASRARIARQLAIEAVVLSVPGVAAALACAAGLSRLVVAYLPPFARAYRLLPATLDWRIAVLSTGMVLLSLLVFGVLPALRASPTDVRATLQGGPVSGRVHRALRADAVLIFAQAAVGIAVLVTGLLIVRSYAALVSTPLGFSPEGLRSVSLNLPSGTAMPRQMEVQRQLYEALRARRIRAALAGGIPAMTVHTGLSKADSHVNRPPVEAWPVSGTFFDVFGVKLIRGRLYSDQEAFSNAPVAVIDQRAADLLWPGADPIGRMVKEIDGTLRTVVGVVPTVRTDLIGARFRRGGAFIPFGERAHPFFLEYRDDAGRISAKELSAIAASVEPGATAAPRPLLLFERELGQPRFLAILLGTLALLAIVLTLLGVFGIVTHEVTRRTKEIGIRIAIGADAPAVRRMVISGALVPALLGALLGISASLWFTETLRSLLYGLGPQDPITHLMTLLLVVATVALGSFLPAWRASRVDPMVSLRAE